MKNALYLNQNRFKFKIVSSPLCSFCYPEDETPIHLFYSYSQTKSLWSKLQDLLNSEMLLPQNTPQNGFFGFPDNNENFEIIINHLHLIFRCYLDKYWDTRKVGLQGLNQNVIKTAALRNKYVSKIRKNGKY